MSQSTQWLAFLAEHGDGGVVNAKVTEVLPFGALLEVAPGVHGLLPHSTGATEPQVGSTIPVRAAEIDVEKRRIRFAAARAKGDGSCA
ncbi:S1 RNA-binding domain-containing protein [Amycolatopsis alkalitolerans]|uniref:S1 RNA-binding domain-containing protein n=1 Tax=Amycolatopsis alkalitolerans TaxID=2547244 RepID=A0A5C4M336_9PSEU|nr:S1 RNA-binding domain-containing protein [Amycolatopsis alkalitolerans]TNC24307.1 S1 RNA-binding domain-containing protein [Amycolatopsis alkalitolerans]